MTESGATPTPADGETGAMQIRQAMEADRRTLSVIAADLQRRPDRHVAYLAEDAHSIAAEMVEEDDDWTAVSAVAELTGPERGDIVGWLMGSIDPDMGRVWWYGPFVEADDATWPSVADALYGFAGELLDRDVDEEELAPDSRFGTLIGWAAGRGFDVDPGSAVLRLAGGVGGRDRQGSGIAVRAIDDRDAANVVGLHDALFPGTHTTGATLVAGADDRHVRLVAELEGAVAGYVAAEVQPDGGGYIDFLGTADRFRRRGVAAELVRAAVAELRARSAGDVHLTVREANTGARALYAGLGFREERVITPLRRGFRLP